MRIALVAFTFLPEMGGAEFVVHHLADQWSKQGHEVCVLNNTTDEPVSYDVEYSVVRYRLLRGSTRFGYHRFPMGWHAQRRLAHLLREFKPGFISAHCGYPTGYWLSRIRPLPRFLVTCHGRDITEFDWGHRKRYGVDEQIACALNKSAGVVAISAYARKLMEEMGVKPTKIFDIPNGVDSERFQTKVNVDIRRKLKIPRNAVVILSVGRENVAKAYDTGIRAFARLHTRIPEAFYLVVGRNTEKWRSLAGELGVGKYVIFCEGLYDDELVGAYQQADVFFSPSVQEMFPLVVLEAMATGLPEVVTNISGSAEAIENGTNGLVVEPGEVDEMADALGRLIEDESLRKRFSQVNLEKSRLYDWSRISKMYLEHA